MRIGEKTLELKGNAKISSIEFLQITEEKAVGEIASFYRTDFEEAAKTAVIVKEGSPIIMVNNALRYLDYNDISVVPVNRDGIIYIPAKALADAISCYYEEDKENDFIIIRKDEREIIYSGGSFTAYEYGQVKSNLSVLPFEADGITYFPLRTVCRFFGETVIKSGEYWISDYSSRVNNLISNWQTEIDKKYSDFMPAEMAGKTYYVSKSDNASDSNDGSINSPYRTIRKASAVAKAGDTIIIREGIWNETITPVSNGTPTAPITYKAMEGEDVTLSTLYEVSSFEETEDGLLTASVPWDLGLGRNQVFYEDKNLIEARYPNAHIGEDGLFEARNGLRLNPVWINEGDIKVNPKNTMTATSDTLLQEEEEDYWKGAIFVSAQGHGWTLQTATVGSSKKGELTFDNVSDVYWSDARAHNPNYGYLTCHKNAIDMPGEWTIKDKTLYIMPPEGETAETLKLKIKRKQVIADLSNSEYVRVEGFKGIGGGIRMNNSKMCVISGCDLSYISHYIFTEDQRSLFEDCNYYDENGAPQSGEMGIYFGGEHNAIINNKISFSAGTAIYSVGTYGYIENNVMTDICYGGTSAGAVHMDIELFKPLDIKRGGHTIIRNTIKNTARTAIDVQSYNERILEVPQSFLPCEIAYNDISDSSICCIDTGAIYFYGSNMGDDFTRTKIHHNYVYQTAPYATEILGAIYMDNRMTGVDIYDNLIFSNLERQYRYDIYEQQASQFPTSYATVDSWNNANVGIKKNGKQDLTVEDFPSGKPFKAGSDLILDNYNLTYNSYENDDYEIYYAKDAALSSAASLVNGKADISSSKSYVMFANVDFSKGNELNIAYTGDYYKGADAVEIIIGSSLYYNNDKLSVSLIPDSKSPDSLNHISVSTADLELSEAKNVWIRAASAGNSAIHSIRVTDKYVPVYDYTNFEQDYKKIYGGIFAECGVSSAGTTYPEAKLYPVIDSRHPTLTNTWGGNWVKYEDVEIKEEVNKWSISIASGGENAGGGVNLRLGSPTGEILGRIESEASNWNLIEKSELMYQSIDPGIYDIYLTFDGDYKCADIYWFGFGFDSAGVKCDYQKIYAGTFSDSHSGSTVNPIQAIEYEGSSLKNTFGGSWVEYANIKVKRAVDTFKIRYDAGATPVTCKLRVGSPDGEVLLSYTTENTGWKLIEREMTLSRVLEAGTYDIYLTFEGDSSCDINWFGLASSKEETGEVTVADVSFINEFGEEVDCIGGAEEILASVKVQNTWETKSKKYKTYAALYNGGQLVKICHEAGVVYPNSYRTVNFTDTFTLEELAENSKIKVFVWSDEVGEDLMP